MSFFLPDPIKLQWTCGDVSQEEDNNYMFSCHCYVGSIHLIMGLQSFNLAPGPSGKKKTANRTEKCTNRESSFSALTPLIKEGEGTPSTPFLFLYF